MTTYRTRPMALDTGTSSDAADTATSDVLGVVKDHIIALLTEHPRTDDELIAAYSERTGSPLWPRVTPQRIRTARADLVRDGQVRASDALAFSDLGNRASLWQAVDRAGQ